MSVPTVFDLERMGAGYSDGGLPAGLAGRAESFVKRELTTLARQVEGHGFTAPADAFEAKAAILEEALELGRADGLSLDLVRTISAGVLGEVVARGGVYDEGAAPPDVDCVPLAEMELRIVASSLRLREDWKRENELRAAEIQALFGLSDEQRDLVCAFFAEVQRRTVQEVCGDVAACYVESVAERQAGAIGLLERTVCGGRELLSMHIAKIKERAEREVIEPALERRIRKISASAARRRSKVEKKHKPTPERLAKAGGLNDTGNGGVKLTGVPDRLLLNLLNSGDLSADEIEAVVATCDHHSRAVSDNRMIGGYTDKVDGGRRQQEPPLEKVAAMTKYRAAVGALSPTQREVFEAVLLCHTPLETVTLPAAEAGHITKGWSRWRIARKHFVAACKSVATGYFSTKTARGRRISGSSGRRRPISSNSGGLGT